MNPSGITLKDEVADVFQTIKTKHKKKYAVLKISDDQQTVEVDEVSVDGLKAETEDEDRECYDELMTRMKDDQCRYILYDFDFKRENKGSIQTVQKLGMISWISDNAPTKTKMLYATTKDTVKKAFNGLANEVQRSDMADLKDYKDVLEKMEKKKN